MTDIPPIDHSTTDGRTPDQRRQDRVRAMEQLMQAAWAFADATPHYGDAATDHDSTQDR